MHKISRLILITLGLFVASAETYASIETQEISFLSQSSNRIIVAEIYYPVSYNIESKKIQHGIWMRENYHKAQSNFYSKQLHPLVIFSHGYQGDRFGNSWLAEALTSKGYIVVMIDHTFNTSYDHNDLFVYTSMWQRPVDISELLTHLLQDPQWSKIIDKDKIAVSGFSLGGTTALWLAGIKADKDHFQQILNDKYSRWDDWPEYAIEKAKNVDWTKSEQSYQDPRIKAIISIAPDLGEAFTQDGLKETQIPILIITGDKDKITPKERNSEYYSKNIIGSELLIIDDAEHFTFMNKCSDIGLKITPHLCSSDHKKEITHFLTIDKICKFLEKYLN